MREKMQMRRRRRSGVALVYVIVAMAAFIGLCSFAVDLGRYEVVHQELYNAAVAAAQAGAAQMSTGSASSVSSAATAVATSNKVDGSPITSGNVTVTYLKWVSASNFTVKSAANISQANAVRVAITYNCPLAFAQILGLRSKTAVEFSTAEVVVQTDTPHVFATGDIWLANEPADTEGSQADPNYKGLHTVEDHQYPYDIAGTPGTSAGGASTYANGQPYSSPIKVGFNVTPGAVITVTNATGSVSYDHDTAPYLSPNANSGTEAVGHNAKANYTSEHGISDSSMPLGSMNAVFTGLNVPDNIQTVPPVLDFSTSASRDYVGLEPKLQQAFYVGDGQTSGNVQQQIVVPQGATYLFLGIMDGWEWNNNNGAFDCTVTQTYITTVQ